MERVTGIGGIFFKSKDPKKLQAWYVKHLGLPVSGDGYVVFEWTEKGGRPGKAQTVWSAFPADTKYYAPSKAPFMVNYRVKNLDALMKQLKRRRAKTVGKIESNAFGKFAWVLDPDGNKVELWQPPKKAPSTEAKS